MNRLLLLNGPNMNLLGTREKDIYGAYSLEDLENELHQFSVKKGYTMDCFQSNHEGELIDQIHAASGKYVGIVFNPAAYTHTSIAIRDAIKAIQVPVIEVHMSNVYARETFRHTSMIAPVCEGQITGLGITGYRLAVLALIDLNRKGENDVNT
ncbi:type II 3-dehydroquinate dehydratase [Lentibacillus saliphilus]|uniref:type II 3-dehydroquinate dehydratase n=1 Tax=Lentibacillus saliphilus TaxID=2737028 RepID=UPI001C2F8CCC|nr:type II 3-dehydroquinate dehydratase [Lentibacillus saliphilus]